MANNYYTTSYILHVKDKTKPFKLGDLAQAFISLYTSDTDQEIVLEDSESIKTYEALFEHLTDSLGLETEKCFRFGDLLPQLQDKLNLETLAKFGAELSNIKADSLDDIYLEDLLHICFEEDNSNFGSFFAETAYWCDKPRYGEFGGYSVYTDGSCILRNSSSSLSNVTPNTVCGHIQKTVFNQIHSINNTELRKQAAVAIYEVIHSYL